MKSYNELIEELKQGQDNKKKGIEFEKICCTALQQKFKSGRVYLLKDLPEQICQEKNMTRKDVGSDAFIIVDETLYAVQCKFSAPKSTQNFSGALRKFVEFLDKFDIEYGYFCSNYKIVTKPPEGVIIVENEELQKLFDSQEKLELRDYQTEAVNKMLALDCGKCTLPTGTGKSYIMLGYLLQQPTRALIVVPNLILLLQIKKLFEKFLPIKVYGANNKALTNEPHYCYITSYNLAGALTDALPFDVALFDEYHRITDPSSKSSKSYSAALGKAKKEFFFSATERIIDERFGTCFSEMTFEEAVRRSLICDFSLAFTETSEKEARSLIKDLDLNFSLEKVMIAVQCLQFIKKGLARKLLFFVKSNIEEYFELLTDLSVAKFPDCKIFTISAKHSDEKCLEILEAFENAQCAVLISSGKISEGVSIDCADAVCFAETCLSEQRVIQSLCRMLRFRENKTCYLILPLNAKNQIEAVFSCKSVTLFVAAKLQDYSEKFLLCWDSDKKDQTYFELSSSYPNLYKKIITRFDNSEVYEKVRLAIEKLPAKLKSSGGRNKEDLERSYEKKLLFLASIEKAEELKVKPGSVEKAAFALQKKLFDKAVKKELGELIELPKTIKNLALFSKEDKILFDIMMLIPHCRASYAARKEKLIKKYPKKAKKKKFNNFESK